MITCEWATSVASTAAWRCLKPDDQFINQLLSAAPNEPMFVLPWLSVPFNFCCMPLFPPWVVRSDDNGDGGSVRPVADEYDLALLAVYSGSLVIYSGLLVAGADQSVDVTLDMSRR